MILRAEALFGFGVPPATEPRVGWCPRCSRVMPAEVAHDGCLTATCACCDEPVGIEQPSTSSMRAALLSRARERMVNKKAPG